MKSSFYGEIENKKWEVYYSQRIKTKNVRRMFAKNESPLRI